MNDRTDSLITRGLLLAGILVMTASLSACAICEALFGTTEAAEPEVVEVVEEVPMPTEKVVLVVSDDIHVVVPGETLWGISGYARIYNDPFRWPLIYAHNKQIEHANLIFPGQELAIRRDLTREDINRAVEHVKNRGIRSFAELQAYDSAYRDAVTMGQ